MPNEITYALVLEATNSHFINPHPLKFLRIWHYQRTPEKGNGDSVLIYVVSSTTLSQIELC